MCVIQGAGLSRTWMSRLVGRTGSLMHDRKTESCVVDERQECWKAVMGIDVLTLLVNVVDEQGQLGK